MANLKELRAKIAARKQERTEEQKVRYGKMRLVAAKAPEKLEKCLAGLAEKCANLAEGWENLRENLGLVRASKESPLKTRVAAARNYAKQFQRIAEEAPEKLGEALVEAYHGLNEIAQDIEMAADQMGVDLEAPLPEGEEMHDSPEPFKGPEEESEPIEEEVIEVGPEPVMDDASVVIEEDKDASGSDAWVTDRGNDREPELPVAANSGSDNFATDRSKGGEPKKPGKLDVPRVAAKKPVSKARK